MTFTLEVTPIVSLFLRDRGLTHLSLKQAKKIRNQIYNKPHFSREVVILRSNRTKDVVCGFGAGSDTYVNRNSA